MEPRIERGAAPDIHRIEDASVNWYLVEADDGLTVIDAGVPPSPLAHRPLRYAHERSRTRYLLTRPKALPHVAGFLAARAFWPPPLQAASSYGDGDVLDVPGEPRAIFTPGHTLGHCALHFPDRDAAIAGDAMVMLDPYSGEKGPRIVAGAATADGGRALRSLDRLAGLDAGTVLTGHGGPWRGGAGEAVRLARQAGPT